MSAAQPRIERPGKRRRWYQYGLRTLLGLIFVAAVGLGWTRHEIDRHRERQDLIAAIEKLEGAVILTKPAGPVWLRKWLGDEYFQGVLQIRLVNYQAAELDIDGLDLALFGELEELDLSNPNIDDDWLSRISGLKRLKSLALEGCSITDACMANLWGLTELKDLNLSDTNITEAGLSPLRELPKLRCLELSGTAVAELSALAGLVNLTTLDLMNCPICDDDLRYLAQLVELEDLDVGLTEVTDQGLVHLRPLANLYQLSLADDRITDAGLKQLYGLNKLANLDLSSDDVHVYLPRLVSSKGLDELKQRIAPGAKVYGIVHDYDLSLLGNRVQQVRRGEVKELGLEGIDVLHLDQIEGLDHLERLDLGETHVDDDGLKHVVGLSGLKTLDLRNSWITDAGLAYVAGLSNLESLDLSDTRVTDAGLAQLGNLTRLTRLNLNNTFVTGTGIRHLRGLAALKELVLSRFCGNSRWSRLQRTMGVTDKGCAAIGLMRGLEQLDLSNFDDAGSQITNTGIKHLAALSQLRDLKLNGAKITDEALSHIGGLSMLESLEMLETDVSKAAVDRLKTRFDDLDVWTDWTL